MKIENADEKFSVEHDWCVIIGIKVNIHQLDTMVCLMILLIWHYSTT